MTSILIVDDDDSLSSIVAEFLVMQGFDVHRVASAEEAYDVLTNRTFDAVLLDINLPHDSGFDVCGHIRARSQVPIIFASARTDIDDEVRGLDLGADDYIAKPYSMKELLAHIRAVLRRSAAATPSLLAIGDVCLDPAARTVMVRGEHVTLSPKEFDVLALLMRNAGTPVPADKILSEVWGAFTEVEPSTVVVHISWLRRKLEVDPAHPVFLKTVPKAGYLVAGSKAAQ